MSSTLDPNQFQKIISENEIQEMVALLADRINHDYQGKKILLVCFLKGAFMFAADLVRKLSLPVEVEFVKLSHHGRSLSGTGTVTLVRDIQRDIRDYHVLVVEEIIDSGRTLSFLYERLKQAQPLSVEVVTLFDKPSKRMADIPVKYVGRTLKDQFVVGYGMDLEEKCRNLGEVYQLKYPN